MKSSILRADLLAALLGFLRDDIQVIYKSHCGFI
jgi:hypothetical protein